MWLVNSSIGRKLVMSISGVFLVLFLLFHMAMNATALFSEAAYDAICEFLGSNWYAVAGTLVLGAGFLVHIVYAFVIWVQNRRARGNDRYAVNAKPALVEWSSQNMLVLGIVVFVGLALHMTQFWSKMMLAELMGAHEVVLGGQTVLPTAGAAFINYYFSNPLNVALYLIWFTALWFHLTHGFWSAMQTLGWNNHVWLNRWKTISDVFATVIFLGFAAVVIGFYLKNLLA